MKLKDCNNLASIRIFDYCIRKCGHLDALAHNACKLVETSTLPISWATSSFYHFHSRHEFTCWHTLQVGEPRMGGWGEGGVECRLCSKVQWLYIMGLHFLNQIQSVWKGAMWPTLHEAWVMQKKYSRSLFCASLDGVIGPPPFRTLPLKGAQAASNLTSHHGEHTSHDKHVVD